MKTIAKLLVPVAFAAAVLFGSAPAAQAADTSINMNQACQIHHGAGYTAHLKNNTNAYSWRCKVQPWGVEKELNIQLYCNAFGLGTATIINTSNPFSWVCRS